MRFFNGNQASTGGDAAAVTESADGKNDSDAKKDETSKDEKTDDAKKDEKSDDAKDETTDKADSADGSATGAAGTSASTGNASSGNAQNESGASGSGSSATNESGSGSGSASGSGSGGSGSGGSSASGSGSSGSSSSGSSYSGASSSGGSSSGSSSSYDGWISGEACATDVSESGTITASEIPFDDDYPQVGLEMTSDAYTHLGKYVEVRYGGITVTAQVVDVGAYHGGNSGIMINPGVFGQFGVSSVYDWGRRNVEYRFV